MAITESHENLFTPHKINNIINKVGVHSSPVKAKYENVNLSTGPTLSELSVVHSIFKLLVGSGNGEMLVQGYKLPVTG